jgi:hypothetical protein
VPGAPLGALTVMVMVGHAAEAMPWLRGANARSVKRPTRPVGTRRRKPPDFVDVVRAFAIHLWLRRICNATRRGIFGRTIPFSVKTWERVTVRAFVTSVQLAGLAGVAPFASPGAPVSAMAAMQPIARAVAVLRPPLEFRPLVGCASPATAPR